MTTLAWSSFPTLVLLLASIAILLAAALHDIATRTVPNWMAGLLALRGIEAGGEAIRAALASAGLEKRRHLPARRLSAGQRRRIGLARLALDPARLWALDEPLTALDDEGRRHFEGLLAGHLGRGGVALIATHHDLAAARARELRMGA